MLFRFSLYGFLKNQRYFEPFLALIFYEKLGSWFMVGLLIAFREGLVNILEIPTGGIADLYGRRKSMIFSFLAYIVGFIVFGYADTMSALMIGMAFFSIGEAFRTGTHKSMIFTWLRLQGRTSERTKIYGYTRSWSKFGSAAMVVIAGGVVLVSRDYNCLFHFAAVMYVLGIINFLGYPRELEGTMARKSVRVGQLVAHLKKTAAFIWRKRSLRELFLEATGYDVMFESGKHYLQPVLLVVALSLTGAFAVTDGLGDRQKSVLLIVPVFFLIHILSALASRNAHRMVAWAGGEAATAAVLWKLALVLFLAITPALYFGLYWVIISGLVVVLVAQNIWRPVLVSRFDAASPESSSSTILSVESQARSLGNMIVAPVLGFAVTLAQTHGVGESEFWPVGVLGAVIALGFVLRGGVVPSRVMKR